MTLLDSYEFPIVELIDVEPRARAAAAVSRKFNIFEFGLLPRPNSVCTKQICKTFLPL
eukprot:SAG22_NODE_18957_length_279_cov_1.138889_1_plen_57_part_01